MNKYKYLIFQNQNKFMDESGEGAINTIAVIAGIAVIAAAIVGALSQMQGPVGDAIRSIITLVMTSGN